MRSCSPRSTRHILDLVSGKDKAMKRAITLCGALALVLTASINPAIAQGPGPRGPDGPSPPSHFRLDWSTRIGGSQYDDLREVILEEDGSLLLGGQTFSPDLPATAGAFQAAYRGEPAGRGHPGLYGGDAFLTRLSASGATITALTYFGGSAQERDVYGMAVDHRGDIVITTTTRSRDMPTTAGAFQRRYGGGVADIVVAELSGDLRRLRWCSYLGGSDDDSPRGGLALDRDDGVVVVGASRSPDFPTTPGVLQPRPAGDHDAVIAKLAPDGSRLVWSTFLGGSGTEVILGAQVGGDGSIYVGGHTQSGDFPVTAGGPQPHPGGQSDAFLARLAPDGSRLLAATLLGGRENEFAEHRLALLGDGSVLLTGVTRSPDFPTTPRAVQRVLRGESSGFVTRLAADGATLVFSSLLGGSARQFLLMPTTDADGNIYIVGQTSSRDFPVTPGAQWGRYGGGASDGVFAILSPDGSRLLYATYVGGRGEDLVRSLALGRDGAVYLVGRTDSEDFPVVGSAARRRAGRFCRETGPARVIDPSMNGSENGEERKGLGGKKTFPPRARGQDACGPDHGRGRPGSAATATLKRRDDRRPGGRGPGRCDTCPRQRVRSAPTGSSVDEPGDVAGLLPGDERRQSGAGQGELDQGHGDGALVAVGRRSAASGPAEADLDGGGVALELDVEPLDGAGAAGVGVGGHGDLLGVEGLGCRRDRGDYTAGHDAGGTGAGRPVGSGGPGAGGVPPLS
jgi:hypothetical protein